MRVVPISSCVECPHISAGSEFSHPKCYSLGVTIKGDINTEVDDRCPLEERAFKKDKDHSLALKHIYSLLNKKGINPDSLHDANVFLEDYISKIGENVC